MSAVRPADRDALAAAARALGMGDVVAYPTEGVYGLGCDPRRPAALEALIRLKGREATKGLILLADRWERLEPFVDTARGPFAVALPLTPAPRTWIFPARPGVSPLLRGAHDGLAVRVTAHPVASALSAAFGGPIVSTSANLSGQSPARTAAEVLAAFPQGLAVILDGPLGGLAGPTEIRDARDGRVIRPAPS